MQLKTNNLKYLNKVKYVVLSFIFLTSLTTMAQEIIEEKEEVKVVEEKKKDNSGREKIDHKKIINNLKDLF